MKGVAKSKNEPLPLPKGEPYGSGISPLKVPDFRNKFNWLRSKTGLNWNQKQPVVEGQGELNYDLFTVVWKPTQSWTQGLPDLPQNLQTALPSGRFMTTVTILDNFISAFDVMGLKSFFTAALLQNELEGLY